MRARAKKEKIPFNLSLTDVVIPKRCPYLGIPLRKETYVGRKKNSPSLDRIDPSKGYIKGNVQVISDMANRMKQNATKEELVTFSTNVLKLLTGT